jgi:phosphoglycolate phosphatase-like HAD superfamily hydrolase
LSYIRAMVYHAREESEQQELAETIEELLHNEDSQREVRRMGRTIAEAIEARGRKQGQRTTLQKTLVRQLRKRFDDVPDEIEQTIKATKSVPRLEDWLDRIVVADSLEDVGISPGGDA